jgi:hypothetical protein
MTSAEPHSPHLGLRPANRHAEYTRGIKKLIQKPNSNAATSDAEYSKNSTPKLPGVVREKSPTV